MNWLDRIIFLGGCIIEVFLLYDYFYNFFEIRIKKEYVRLVCAVTCLLLFSITLLENALVNLVCAPIILWIFVTIIFEAKLWLRIGYFIIAYGVMLSGEFLCTVMTNTTAEVLDRVGLIRMSEIAWQAFLIRLLNYIIFLILKQMSSRSRMKIVDKLFALYLCVPITTLGIMITIFYSGIDFNGHFFLKVLMTILLFLMTFGSILLFYAFQKHTENISENARQQMEILHQKAEVERLTQIAELNESHRQLVHDTSHYLKLIGKLAQENKYDELYEIVEKLNGTLFQGEVVEYCGHRMLDTILSEYREKAKQSEISFDAYVEPGSTLRGIEDVDLITMLGNILDNAWLAASKIDMASISVRIFMQKDGGLCVIKVVNDFIGELKEINDKLVSTKRDKGIHGVGISSVKKTAKRYGGFFEHYVEQKRFHAVLVLPT
ncbi:MAG: GHKL domain-containing protein [Lachnospiraceae bacterium]|nr:GHKL domain-containing protein [Lachnospiraceae bacterium]